MKTFLEPLVVTSIILTALAITYTVAFAFEHFIYPFI